MNRKSGRRMLAAGISVSLLTLAALAAPQSALAWSDDIIRNCTEDYFAYCKEHSPESAELRYCMEAHRNQISKQCVKALINAGEVPKKYLANVPQSQQKK
jgi:hypothetical protein